MNYFSKELVRLMCGQLADQLLSCSSEKLFYTHLKYRRRTHNGEKVFFEISLDSYISITSLVLFQLRPQKYWTSLWIANHLKFSALCLLELNSLFSFQIMEIKKCDPIQQSYGLVHKTFKVVLDFGFTAHQFGKIALSWPIWD